MRRGRFEPVARHEDTAYERGDWEADELDPGCRAGRRRWLTGIVVAAGVLVPAGGGYLLGLILGSARETDRPGLPAWVRAMQRAPAHSLIEDAGEYERKTFRHRGQTAIAPAFERLLGVAIDSSHAYRDAAAACALRSLARLGAIDRVRAWLPRLDASLPRARQAARESLEDGLPRARRRPR